MPQNGLVGPGAVLASRYVVEAIIGAGGMGSVYAALDRELGERVALKVLSRSSEVGSDGLERFRREVRVARRVTHHNAVRTFDIGEHGGLYFLTMELVEGESLAELLRREGALAPTRVADIGRQICEGLAAVHEAGIVHRDLKPSNVLVAGSGRIVLTDFGIARSQESDDQLTMGSHVVVGTPHYMAPEQLAGDPVTTRADLYSLGLVLYEMVTGRRPFDHQTGLASAVARLREDPTPPHDHAEVPAWLDDAIMACLRREAGQRPPDARAVLAMLSASAPAVTRAAALDITRSIGGEDTERTSAVTRRTGPRGGEPSGAVGSEGGTQSLAVLPLRYRGPADDAYLAEAMTEHLVDLLSMTRGLRVPAEGATQRFAEDRDPRAVGEALGVDAVVDGTVQRMGTQLRVSVRLLDGRTGYQTWSGRVDGTLEDVFELQDHIATRVVETLRLQLESRAYEHSAPAEAIEAYLRARLGMRGLTLGRTGPDSPAALLERCLELAPDFAPALAAYATVCARMWFFRGSPEGEHDWVARGKDAVARALVVGSRLPDTYLGAARMYAEGGCFGEAARALQQGLQLAPTHAAIHAYLGILQCEAGRSAVGIRHIELAVELDPTRVAPLLTAARHLALHGERERYRELTQRVWDEDPDARFATVVTHLRVSLWDRDDEALRRWRDAVAAIPVEPGRLLQSVASHVLGELDHETVEQTLEEVAPQTTSSPRFRALLEQCVVEGLLVRGRDEEALVWLERLADGTLVDVDWLEHCPLFTRLLDGPRMWTVRRKVEDRARLIWAIR